MRTWYINKEGKPIGNDANLPHARDRGQELSRTDEFTIILQKAPGSPNFVPQDVVDALERHGMRVQKIIHTERIIILGV